MKLLFSRKDLSWEMAGVAKLCCLARVKSRSGELRKRRRDREEMAADQTTPSKPVTVCFSSRSYFLLSFRIQSESVIIFKLLLILNRRTKPFFIYRMVKIYRILTLKIKKNTLRFTIYEILIIRSKLGGVFGFVSWDHSENHIVEH